MHGPRLWCAIACAACGVAGCTSQKDQLRSELETSASWLSTVEAVTAAWSANRLPVHYVERTIEEARTQLTSAKQPAAAQAVDAVLRAVRQRRYGTITEPLARVRRERQSLEARLNSVKASP